MPGGRVALRLRPDRAGVKAGASSEVSQRRPHQEGCQGQDQGCDGHGPRVAGGTDIFHDRGEPLGVKNVAMDPNAEHLLNQLRDPGFFKGHVATLRRLRL